MLLHKTIMIKSFSHDFLFCNISAYQILIWHFDRIFDQKTLFFINFLSFWSYFQIWVSYMPKIADRSEISATPRVSQITKKLINSRKFAINSNIFRCRKGARGRRNFWPIGDFWPMMSYKCWYEIICIYDTHIWKYDQKLKKWMKKRVF